MRERLVLCARLWLRKEVRTRDRASLFIRLAGQKRWFSLPAAFLPNLHRYLASDLPYDTRMENVSTFKYCTYAGAPKLLQTCIMGLASRNRGLQSGFGLLPGPFQEENCRRSRPLDEGPMGAKSRADSTPDYCGGEPAGGPEGRPEGGPEGPFGGGPPIPPPTLKAVAVKAPSLTAPSARTVSPT